MAKEIEVKTMPQDMSADEIAELGIFMDNGFPGLAKTKESDIFQWFELYMAGRTYSEIAIATRKKKEYILFMSHKQNWFDKKMAHYDGLMANMSDKLQQTKLESLNTISTIVSALGKFYGEKFTKYLTTKDADIIRDMDTKMLSQYYKSVDSLDKLLGNAAQGDSDRPNAPLVNFNLSAGTTISQIDNKTLEITDGTAGDLLRLLADAKKAKSDGDQ